MPSQLLTTLHAKTMSPKQMNTELLEALVTVVKLTKAQKNNEIKATVENLAQDIKNSYPDVSRELMRAVNLPVFRSANDYNVSNTTVLNEIPEGLLFEGNRHWNIKPSLTSDISNFIEHVILEHNNIELLNNNQLKPITSILFTGAPGTGKTYTANWLAHCLKKPIYTLNLATFVSSYLGKTGENISKVFDFAQDNECILFLDEIDTLAKTRNDEKDVGELKRIVTVLIQCMDNWNNNSILIAATNHPEILDKAIWRRFEKVIDFKVDKNTLLDLILTSYSDEKFNFTEVDKKLFNSASTPHDFTEIINKVKKDVVLGISKFPFSDEIIKNRVLESKNKLSYQEISNLYGISTYRVKKIMHGNEE